ncbi:hypothetical protein BCR43DRAFT_513219 [Syncephalastrum racemosum]|uniref:Uncharacterized protein n=1 Tax=Syncephalastrum racemosum TaxID=13706 RepID=A0A1X2HIZ9_SYNRA|nr:hypothetical protein BCR43DRAFT_513219 [Syncephalastrum racemosum]
MPETNMNEAILALSTVTVCIAVGFTTWTRSAYPYMPIFLAAVCHAVGNALAIGSLAQGATAASWVFDVLFYPLAWCVPFGALRTDNRDHPHWVFERNIGIYLAYLWTIVIAGMATVSGTLAGTASMDHKYVERMKEFCTCALWAYPVLWLIQWLPLRRYKFPRGVTLSLHVYFVSMVLVTTGRCISGPFSDDGPAYIVGFVLSEIFAILTLWWAIGVGVYWTRSRRNIATAPAPTRHSLESTFVIMDMQKHTPLCIAFNELAR